MTENELREKHPVTIADYAEIEVRLEWLPLIDSYFEQVESLYGGTGPSVCLFNAYELDGQLVVDLDDTPWTGNQDRTIKRQVRELALALSERSRNGCLTN
ncbi:hypothetical protein AB4Z52_13690 [Rhizobium sp. 2YAF20]|uniref:hypothetical protein n=1 Tax=Rhizobium sp. 2YAF20 TaxID=3233027 RepID=UPI003F9EB18D